MASISTRHFVTLLPTPRVVNSGQVSETDTAKAVVSLKAAPDFPITSLADDFNRANENPIVGAWSTPILSTDSNAQVLANIWSTGFASASSYLTGVDIADSEAWFTIVGLFGIGPVVRVSDPGAAPNYYQLFASATGVTLRKSVAGSITNLQVVNLPMANGDKLGIRASGTTITGYIKRTGDTEWQQVAQATDSDLTSGSIGISGAASSVDDFGGGDLSTEQIIPVTQVSETDTSQAISVRKTKTLGQNSETDTANPITVYKPIYRTVNQVTETDTSNSITSKKTTSIGQSSTTDTSQTLTSHKSKSTGQSSETDTAQLVTPKRIYDLLQASETDSVVGALYSKKNKIIGQNSETDTAQEIRPTRIIPIGQASETDSSTSFTHSKNKELGQSSETDSAQAITRNIIIPVGQVSETDSSGAVTSHKTVHVGQTTETDLAQSISSETPIEIGQTVETDTANAITSHKTVAIGQAIESDTSNPIGKIDPIISSIGQASENESALPITFASSAGVGITTESDSADSINSHKYKGINQDSEEDSALSITPVKVVQIIRAEETDTADSVSKFKVKLIGEISEDDTSQLISPRKTTSVSQASETDESTTLSVLKKKILSQSSEIDEANPFGKIDTVLGIVGQAIEEDFATQIVKRLPVVARPGLIPLNDDQITELEETVSVLNFIYTTNMINIVSQVGDLGLTEVENTLSIEIENYITNIESNIISYGIDSLEFPTGIELTELLGIVPLNDNQLVGLTTAQNILAAIKTVNSLGIEPNSRIVGVESALFSTTIYSNNPLNAIEYELAIIGIEESQISLGVEIV
jgi:hypothetical protein